MLSGSLKKKEYIGAEVKKKKKFVDEDYKITHLDILVIR
jgi:hypothetical protein